MVKTYEVEAVILAVKMLKKDGKTIFELFEKDRKVDSKFRSRIRAKTKPIEKQFLQKAIDNYPKFEEYLEEATIEIENEANQLPAPIAELDSKLAEMEKKTMISMELILDKLRLMDKDNQELKREILKAQALIDELRKEKL